MVATAAAAAQGARGSRVWASEVCTAKGQRREGGDMRCRCGRECDVKRCKGGRGTEQEGRVKALEGRGRRGRALAQAVAASTGSESRRRFASARRGDCQRMLCERELVKKEDAPPAASSPTPSCWSSSRLRFGSRGAPSSSADGGAADTALPSKASS